VRGSVAQMVIRPGRISGPNRWASHFLMLEPLTFPSVITNIAMYVRSG
jgi:hypothetical protein